MTDKIKVGDRVQSVDPQGHPLRSGAEWYPHATVACLHPFVLISDDGDMAWTSTRTPEDVRVIGTAPDAAQKAARERLARLRQDGSIPKAILVHVNLFTETGKWKYGFDVEVDDQIKWDHRAVLQQIDDRQTDVIKGTVTRAHYYVVLTDDPEQRRNPTGSFFMMRLYTPAHIRELFTKEVASDHSSR